MGYLILSGVPPLLLYFFPQGHFPRVYKPSYAKMKELHFQEEMLKICVEGKISFNLERHSVTLPGTAEIQLIKCVFDKLLFNYTHLGRLLVKSHHMFSIL